jgi:hypothetical protein
MIIVGIKVYKYLIVKKQYINWLNRYLGKYKGQMNIYFEIERQISLKEVADQLSRVLDC